MIEKNQLNVHIIGAGISGLIAAKELESKGYQPIVIESTKEVGGRVKTDFENGYPMDHGFQVLLDAYPMAKKHLDYGVLDLHKLQPGTVVFKNGKPHIIGDPLRNSSFLFSTLKAPIGTFKDKLKILKLNRKLRAKSLETIFNSPESSTLKYLKNFGFSESIISQFFKPFFTGIFLENELKTSSRMFEFIYKMFGEGYATLPREGMSSISHQLKNQLTSTTFLMETPVEKISNETLILTNGEVLKSDFTIVATNPASLIPNMAGTIHWKSCDSLYFQTHSKVMQGLIIGLNTRSNSYVNNIFYVPAAEETTSTDGELLSVTIVKEHQLPLEDLIAIVTKELALDFGITDVQFVKHYSIPHALPDVQHVAYTHPAGESRIMERVALAGDHQLNGSLNAAMISGELAAEAAHEVLSGNKY